MHLIRKGVIMSAVVLLALLGAACHNPSDEEDDRACQQTYEFGNYGCAEVRGQVLGTGRAPLSGVMVGPVNWATNAAYDSPFVTTDREGRFTFRIHRYTGPAAPAAPDTFSIFVRAIMLRAGVEDSVPVTLTLSPLGRVPTPATVEIRLAYP